MANYVGITDRDRTSERVMTVLIGRRVQLGKSVKDVADALGLYRSTVGRWEKGEIEPTLAQLQMYARYLGMALAVEVQAPSPKEIEEWYNAKMAEANG